MAPEAEARPNAKHVLRSSILDIELQREQPRPCPWVDYSDARGNQSFEVKTVTCEEFRRLDAQIHDEPFFESTVLQRRGWVIIDVPPMQDKFLPTPDFPRDPEQATVWCLAEASLIMQSHDDRIAEFEARCSGGELAVPKVRGLAGRLERHLTILESHSIDCTRGAQESSADLRIALRQISVLTRDAICINHPGHSEYASWSRDALRLRLRTDGSVGACLPCQCVARIGSELQPSGIVSEWRLAQATSRPRLRLLRARVLLCNRRRHLHPDDTDHIARSD